MRLRHSIPVSVLAIAISVIALAGCSNSFSSGLPSHVKTVEVQIFRNKTMYNSIEAILTRSIIDRINADPRIRVVSRNGDALITGEIMSVNRSTIRETTTNEPGTVEVTVNATFSFYDNVEGKFLLEDVSVNSAASGRSSGIYESSLGDTSAEGERGASEQLAAEIVRRTVGMW